MKHAALSLLLLLLLGSCSGGGKHMLALLEQAEEMNRTGQPFTSDSIGKVLVQYYSQWWQRDRNLRMRAYYMLGCAYRDRGEAPAALHFYDIATRQADTFATTCDYATLFRVYGQMAMVYGWQNMPREKRDALKNYGRYAWMAGDTLNHIIAYEQMTDVCYQLNDTAGVFAYTDTARTLYQKYGLPQKAASVYPTAIYVCLLNGNYTRAHQYMKVFESEAGLFDAQGNIEKGREQYYNSKGLYYLGTGKTDSAEIYYHRLLSYGYLIEACEGLLSIYESRKDIDSIMKYIVLYKEAQMAWAAERQSTAIIQSSAMYKYERNQKLAVQKVQEASQFRMYLWAIGFVSVLTLTIFYIAYNKVKQRSREKEQEYAFLEKQYENKVAEYQQLTNEYSILRNNYSSFEIPIETRKLLQEKEERITTLENELGWYIDKGGVLDVIEKEECIRKEEVVAFFEDKTLMTKGWKAPSKQKWGELSNIYKHYFPLVYSSIVDMAHQELYTCILTHIGFSTGMIAILLDTSSQRITNVKRKANQRLAGDNSAPTLLQTLRNLAKGIKQR